MYICWKERIKAWQTKKGKKIDEDASNLNGGKGSLVSYKSCWMEKETKKKKTIVDEDVISNFEFLYLIIYTRI